MKIVLDKKNPNITGEYKGVKRKKKIKLIDPINLVNAVSANFAMLL
jgi:hypothetical protein